MINKTDLKSVISKYHIGGLVEQVKWEIKDSNLAVKFMSPSKEMLGEVRCSKFPLDDCSFGISNTTQLVKLIDITKDVIQLNTVKVGKVCSKLLLADNQFQLNYALADILTIPKTGETNFEESYNITTTLDSEAIGSIIKAQGALTNSETVVIQPSLSEDGEHELELTFGGDVEYANKVSFYLPNLIQQNVPSQYKLHYNSELIKEILYCNKDMISGTLSINLEGLIKLEFQNGIISSTYYLVQKEI
jgi:hypothetical protein